MEGHCDRKNLDQHTRKFPFRSCLGIVSQRKENNRMRNLLGSFQHKNQATRSLGFAFRAFELYPEHKATDKPFCKIKLNIEKESVFEKTVVLSDLDIVNHVNNVKYLEWCLDYVDEKIIFNQKIKSFEMNFIKELSLKDLVVIHKNVNPTAVIFSIIKEEKTCFALQLNF